MTAQQQTPACPKIHLILGGARSGKTAHAEAEALARAGGRKPFYLATGQAFDDEMKARIVRHQSIRGERFHTLEEPMNIAASIRNLEPGAVLLVDSIGTWITNLMLAEGNLEEITADCLDALRETSGEVVLVSDETGLGIVPDNAMARQFRDHIGMFNQQVASMADRVVLVVAGLPLIIKDNDA
ncbi:MAG: bifunctional adenosylcobinamide kinase/adenosylcobinamide-phosphate guanylyltransferase [Candidatus Puniceispirillales bacterium]